VNDDELDAVEAQRADLNDVELRKERAISDQLRTENVKLKQMLESSPPDLLIRNVSGETIVRTVPRELLYVGRQFESYGGFT
jgi:Spy/CpxP family protein refolding chaperone